MGINCTIAKYFNELSKLSVFEGGGILELGPQDISITKDLLNKIILNNQNNIRQKKLSLNDVANSISNILIDFKKRKENFYQLFCKNKINYYSVDYYDNRANFIQNLNTAICAPMMFNVIIDSGTSEHVFNVANVFKYTHNSLLKNGFMIKILPAYGDNTHGFYNIHPNIYFDFAKANNYEVIDFRYIDNINSDYRKENIETFITQQEFEKCLDSFQRLENLQNRISQNFLKSLKIQNNINNKTMLDNAIDYCFVTMKKLRYDKIRYFGQQVYLFDKYPQQIINLKVVSFEKSLIFTNIYLSNFFYICALIVIRFFYKLKIFFQN
jgi:hypothetical protein